MALRCYYEKEPSEDSRRQRPPCGGARFSERGSRCSLRLKFAPRLRNSNFLISSAGILGNMTPPPELNLGVVRRGIFSLPMQKRHQPLQKLLANPILVLFSQGII